MEELFNSNPSYTLTFEMDTAGVVYSVWVAESYPAAPFSPQAMINFDPFFICFLNTLMASSRLLAPCAQRKQVMKEAISYLRCMKTEGN